MDVLWEYQHHSINNIKVSAVMSLTNLMLSIHGIYWSHAVIKIYNVNELKVCLS